MIAHAFPVRARPGRTSPSTDVSPFLPRFIRLRDAPSYLGMDKNRFNREVRPAMTVINIGKQGIAFDRLDLDAWAEEYKSRNGRPAVERSKPWDEASNDECQDSSFGAESGTSIKSYTARAFAKALAQAISKKPKRS